MVKTVRGLRRSDPEGDGYHRVPHGKGFTYQEPDGTTLQDQGLRARFEALGIPPAWRDVWIAPYENGHIQAIGFDAANRKQYIYHPTWRERNDQRKFERMLELAEALPAARRRVTTHLRDEGLTKRRALAAAFRMLDSGGLRIGSARYEEANGSYGLTTLLVRHATVQGDRVTVLDFPAKSHKQWVGEVRDRELARYIRALQEGRAPDERLLFWLDGDGEGHSIAPTDVNAYVKKRTGRAFSAKDFRTLRGTAAAAVSLAKHGPERTETKRRKAVAQAMRDAAAQLSNTPTVARASYVDPRIVQRYEAGRTIDPQRTKAAEAELRAMLFPRARLSRPNS